MWLFFQRTLILFKVKHLNLQTGIFSSQLSPQILYFYSNGLLNKHKQKTIIISDFQKKLKVMKNADNLEVEALKNEVARLLEENETLRGYGI